MGRMSVAIMAHPKRRHHVPELQDALPQATVVWDQHDNRWDTGRRSMAAHDPAADWHLVVQDDAVLCADFLQGVRLALSHCPEVPVSFYTGQTRPYAVEVMDAVIRARKARSSWLAMRGPLWGVAVAVPVPLIPGMLEACEGLDVPNYDMRMSEHFCNLGLECWYSIPSLVDHRVGPDNPSLVPGRGHSDRRTAHAFIGEASPLDVNWGSDPLRVHDPSEPWRLNASGSWACNRCHHVADDLAGMLAHAHREHDLERVDLLAATSGTAKTLAQLWQAMPATLRGTLWVCGKESSAQVPPGVDLVVVRRTEAKRKLGKRPSVFTITATRDALKYLWNRTGWSLEGAGN